MSCVVGLSASVAGLRGPRPAGPADVVAGAQGAWARPHSGPPGAAWVRRGSLPKQHSIRAGRGWTALRLPHHVDGLHRVRALEPSRTGAARANESAKQCSRFG